MKNIKPFILEPMNFPPDKYEICIWEMDYSGKPEFETIQKYILEGNIYYGFGADTDIVTASVEAYIDCINKFKR